MGTLKALCLAGLLLLLPSSVEASPRFSEWHVIWDREQAAVMFQVSISSQSGETADLRARVDEALDVLDEAGYAHRDA